MDLTVSSIMFYSAAKEPFTTGRAKIPYTRDHNTSQRVQIEVPILKKSQQLNKFFNFDFWSRRMGGRRRRWKRRRRKRRR